MLAGVLSTLLNVLPLRWYSKRHKPDQWLFHSVSGKLTLNCWKTMSLIVMDAGQPIFFVSRAKGRGFTNAWSQVSWKEILKLVSFNMQDNISSFKYGINFYFYHSFIWGIWSQSFHHENNSRLISNANQLTGCHTWEHWL